MITVENAYGYTDFSNDLHQELVAFVSGVFGVNQRCAQYRLYGMLEFELDQVGLEISQRGHPGPLKMRTLKAHGFADNDRYFFTEQTQNGRRVIPVTDWMEKNADYDLLYITCCNNGVRLPAQKRAFIVYPLRTGKITDGAFASELDTYDFVPPIHSNRQNACSDGYFRELLKLREEFRARHGSSDVLLA